MEVSKLVEELKERIENCRKCSLWRFRKKVIVGEGPIPCDFFFLGQNPMITANLIEFSPYVYELGVILFINLTFWLRQKSTFPGEIKPLKRDGNKVLNQDAESVFESQFLYCACAW
jgi:hypothetical protein